MFLLFFINNEIRHNFFMENIFGFDEFVFESKTAREIVRDLARRLSFDKDVIEYLNTSRSKRKIGWREFLDYKLHGKNKNWITYITKNMVSDYNPQIVGYVSVKDDEDAYDKRLDDRREKKFGGMTIEDQLNDINHRLAEIEDIFGIYPDNYDSIDAVENALGDIGYVKPEKPGDDIDEPESIENSETEEDSE